MRANQVLQLHKACSKRGRDKTVSEFFQAGWRTKMEVENNNSTDLSVWEFRAIVSVKHGSEVPRV